MAAAMRIWCDPSLPTLCLVNVLSDPYQQCAFHNRIFAVLLHNAVIDCIQILGHSCGAINFGGSDKLALRVYK